jgi:hypothetical protein
MKRRFSLVACAAVWALLSGLSGSGNGVSGSGHNGVLGATIDLNGYGVYGEDSSVNGIAIFGEGGTGVGVKGHATTAGVYGIGGTGVAGEGAVSGVPHALATARNDPNNNNVSDTFVVSIREIETNLVTFNIIRIDSNAAWGQNLLLDWMAWE